MNVFNIEHINCGIENSWGQSSKYIAVLRNILFWSGPDTNLLHLFGSHRCRVQRQAGLGFDPNLLLEVGMITIASLTVYSSLNKYIFLQKSLLLVWFRQKSALFWGLGDLTKCLPSSEASEAQRLLLLGAYTIGKTAFICRITKK
jgi:hypothetical protein